MSMGSHVEFIGLTIRNADSKPTVFSNLKILVSCSKWNKVRKYESVF